MSLTGNAFPSKYDILATDFDETVLSDAKNAIYKESDIKTIPENRRRRLDSQFGALYTIAGEVADLKLGNPYLSNTPDQRDYIESPYSQRSYFDFFDNISSIQYSLYGQQNTSANANSIMAYLEKYNASMAADLKSKLEAALSALSTAKAGTPFVVDSHSANAKAAMDAINELDDALNEAASWIAAN